MTEPTRPIGSDFEVVDERWLTADHEPPWQTRSDGITYTESGRQALALVASYLTARGRNTLVLPSLFCESMIAPFMAMGWRILVVSLDERLDVDRSALLGRLDDPEHSVYLHTPYFGKAESESGLALLTDLEARGMVVVVDESHGLLEATRHPQRIRVASLRKLLPLPDGGFVAGIPVPGLGLPTGERAAAVRWRAMIQKSAFLQDPRKVPVSLHLEEFRRAEELTESSPTPAPMSERSRSVVRRLDYAALRKQRRANFAAIRDGLAGSSHPVVETSAGWATPSHAVVAARDPRALQVHLSRHGVYCPVHWVAPADPRLTAVGGWRGNLLSLPVDHRYDPDDMARIVALLRDPAAQGL